jgi:hypothetical protein
MEVETEVILELGVEFSIRKELVKEFSLLAGGSLAALMTNDP